MNSASTFVTNEMAKDLWGREGNRDDDKLIIIAGLRIWLGWSFRELGVATGRVLMVD